MPTEAALKVGADHLRRDAFLYVRQSSLRQVFENTESTKRQYALRDRAVALGWPIERAALSRTLIMDEDGIYDPAHFNDRLLLGLKGTMSEAELHILKSRLQGGILNKARRGELEMPLPIGLVYTADARVVLDPDRQIQDTVRLLFDTFRETGSARARGGRLRGPKVLFPRG